MRENQVGFAARACRNRHQDSSAHGNWLEFLTVQKAAVVTTVTV